MRNFRRLIGRNSEQVGVIVQSVEPLEIIQPTAQVTASLCNVGETQKGERLGWPQEKLTGFATLTAELLEVPELDGQRFNRDGAMRLVDAARDLLDCPLGNSSAFLKAPPIGRLRALQFPNNERVH